ncbi:hypothetical protein NPX13_g2697 [Xylaria arbuscula]|uniref:Uncharacterized protein n=1 Tax=Xylaria arbuscula TaxID=114810 RepID=A0A9W8TNX3_9PEZI|nr:hypothetical protein NPX13_g2697 [Xylaria arbuscula]
MDTAATRVADVQDYEVKYGDNKRAEASAAGHGESLRTRFATSWTLRFLLLAVPVLAPGLTMKVVPEPTLQYRAESSRLKANTPRRRTAFISILTRASDGLYLHYNDAIERLSLSLMSREDEKGLNVPGGVARLPVTAPNFTRNASERLVREEPAGWCDLSSHLEPHLEVVPSPHPLHTGWLTTPAAEQQPAVKFMACAVRICGHKP